MLPGKRGYPEIVTWNRSAATLQFISYIRVLLGCVLIDGQHPVARNCLGQPSLISSSITRLADPVTILSQYDNRYRDLHSITKDGAQCLMTICCRRQCIRVQYQSRSSGSK